MVLVRVAPGQTFGALKSLVEVSEDEEYRDEALVCISRTSHICIYGWWAGSWGGIRASLAGFHASFRLVRAPGDIYGD